MRNRELVFEFFKKNKERLSNSSSHVSKENYVPVRAGVWLTLIATLLSVFLFIFDVPGKFLQFKSFLALNWLQSSAWDGLYINNPEGIVDLVDLGLSSTDLQISLEYNPETREIQGYMTSMRFCEAHFPFPLVFLSGEVNWITPNSVVFRVFDVVYGKKVFFGSVKIFREGDVIEVQGLEDIFTGQIRLASTPSSELTESNIESQLACFLQDEMMSVSPK